MNHKHVLWSEEPRINTIRANSTNIYQIIFSRTVLHQHSDNSSTARRALGLTRGSELRRRLHTHEHEKIKRLEIFCMEEERRSHQSRVRGYGLSALLSLTQGANNLTNSDFTADKILINTQEINFIWSYCLHA